MKDSTSHEVITKNCCPCYLFGKYEVFYSFFPFCKHPITRIEKNLSAALEGHSPALKSSKGRRLQKGLKHTGVCVIKAVVHDFNDGVFCRFLTS